MAVLSLRQCRDKVHFLRETLSPTRTEACVSVHSHILRHQHSMGTESVPRPSASGIKDRNPGIEPAKAGGQSEGGSRNLTQGRLLRQSTKASFTLTRNIQKETRDHPTPGNCRWCLGRPGAIGRHPPIVPGFPLLLSASPGAPTYPQQPLTRDWPFFPGPVYTSPPGI